MASRKKTEFHKTAEAKGWLLEQIAERWGISIRQMSRVANNATRKDLDAVNGLPKFGGMEKQSD
jgi:hypothetical protein